MRLVGSAAFKAVGTSDPRPAGSIPVHLRQFVASRIRALLLLTFGFIAVVPPSGASADPAEPGNTESIVESITPPNPAVKIDIVGGDAFVRMRVERGHTVEMNGYYDEPFVRVDENGDAFVNVASQTHELSRTRYGATSIDDKPTSTADPVWRRESTNGTVLWHDHRVHWMSTAAPRATDESGLVQQWTIPMKIDGVATVVAGGLYVRDAPGTWWWILAIPALVVGFVLSRRSAPRELAAGGAAFAVTGAFMFWGLPTQARGAPGMFALGVLAVIISVATAVFRHRDEIVDALVASAAVALLMAVVIERETVTNKFVPGLGDSIVVRLTVPLVAGLAVGAGARALKRLVGKPEVAESV